MEFHRCAEGEIDLQSKAGSTVVEHSKRYPVSYLNNNLIASRPYEHPPVKGNKCQNV